MNRRFSTQLFNCGRSAFFGVNLSQHTFTGTKLKLCNQSTSGLCFARNLLSSSYGACPDLDEEFYSDYDGRLSNICLHMDRCNERNFAFSSLALDRMVSFMKSADDVDVAPYYFYKFRHTDNNYFLRPWTVHMWSQKCIDFNKKDLLVQVIQDKLHYGLFPNNIICNQLMDKFLMENDFNSAFTVLHHMFLTEDCELASSQKLGLLVLLKYYNEKKADTTNFLDSVKEDTTIMKSFGGILYRLGSYQNLTSLQIVGLSVLSFVEQNNGIRAVYQDPWAPLMWTENYLIQALNILKSVETPVSTEAVDLLLSVAEGKPEEMSLKIEKDILAEKKLLSNDMNFESVVKNVTKSIEEHENEDNKIMENVLKEWKLEREIVYNMEKELLSKQSEDRAAYHNEREIQDKRHKLAVESLGYWDLAKFDEDGITLPEFKEDPNNLQPHLRDNYVPGALSDIAIENNLQKYK